MPGEKARRFLWMMLDHRELTKIVLPICEAVPNTTSVLDTLVTVLGCTYSMD